MLSDPKSLPKHGKKFCTIERFYKSVDVRHLNNHLRHLPTFKNESFDVFVDSSVELIIVIEHHASAIPCLHYCSDKYPNILVIALGGCVRRNEKWFLRFLQNDNIRRPIAYWADLDKNSVCCYMLIVIGSVTNVLDNLELAVLSVIYMGLHAQQIINWRIKSSQMIGQQMKDMKAAAKNMTEPGHPFILFMKNVIKPFLKNFNT